jgi:3',5'-cyclic AMP phosphodiesterase CpdA
MVSTVDHFSHLQDQRNLNLWTLSKLAVGFYKAFRKKMTASSYDPVLLKRLAHFAYENARGKEDDAGVEGGLDKLDAIILTGDLATTGNQNDIQLVKSFLQSTGNSRYPYLNDQHEATLGAIQIPIWFLPGNHDRLVPTLGLSWARNLPFPKFFEPGGTQFDNYLGDFKTDPAQVLGLLPAASPTSLRVVIIAADFSLKSFGHHEGLYGWLAQGRIYNDVLASLLQKTEDQIAAHKEDPRGTLCVLWAIHFPPGFPHISQTNRILFEERLTAEAKQCGVKAILAGHTHEQVRYRKPAMTFSVICCGSTTQHVPPNTRGANRFQIINIAVSTANEVDISVENYKYKRVGEDGVGIAHFYRED